MIRDTWQEDASFGSGVCSYAIFILSAFKKDVASRSNLIRSVWLLRTRQMQGLWPWRTNSFISCSRITRSLHVDNATLSPTPPRKEKPTPAWLNEKEKDCLACSSIKSFSPLKKFKEHSFVHQFRSAFMLILALSIEITWSVSSKYCVLATIGQWIARVDVIFEETINPCDIAIDICMYNAHSCIG